MARLTGSAALGAALLAIGVTAAPARAAVPIEAVGSSGAATMSTDGRYVAFVTAAALVSTDDNGAGDVYLRDTRRGTVRRVGTDHDPEGTLVEAHDPRLSPDGRYLAYSSFHRGSGVYDPWDVIQVRNLRTGGALVLDGGRSAQRAVPLWIDDDGRYVLTQRTYTASHDSTGLVIRSDRATGTWTLVNPTTDSDGQFIHSADEGQASEDGRTVAFIGAMYDGVTSTARAYVLTAGGGARRIPAADLTLDRAQAPVLSGDGRVLAYLAFRYGGAAAVVLADTARGGPARTTEFRGIRGELAPTSLSRDGRTLALVRLVRTSAGDHTEIVVQDRAGTRVVHTAPGRSLLQSRPQLSGDGCQLLFRTDRALSPHDHNDLPDTYLTDLHTGAVHLISAG
jgi:Tol biopolymer transport system component